MSISFTSCDEDSDIAYTLDGPPLLTRYRVTGLNSFFDYRSAVLMAPLLGLSFYLATMCFKRSSDLEFWYGCY